MPILTLLCSCAKRDSANNRRRHLEGNAHNHSMMKLLLFDKSDQVNGIPLREEGWGSGGRWPFTAKAAVTVENELFFC